MIRPPDSLKSSANRLADLLGSEQGHRILRLLAEFGCGDASAHPNNQPASAFSSPVPGRVGIWERESRDEEVCFIRERDSTYWGLWAQVEMIRLRPESRKVVLLGESVARGFFYDPHFNPAMALEQILRSASPGADIDVIDLARIGIGLKELLELACSSIELEPDVLVILAGNNWRPVVGLSVEDRQDMIDIWRRTGAWSEIRTLVEDKLRYQVNDFITSLASIAGTHRVVIIIPEFNLLDWREDGGPALLLDSNENDQWILAREEARLAFSKRDFARCAKLARQMLQIDGGTSSTAYRLLADIAIEKGELQEARELLQTARDVGIFLPRVETPRCYSIIQESLKQAAKAHGIAVIDLPKAFEEYLGGGLPGRDLFHDYCHFTADGIRLSMSATAEAVLPMIGESARPWRELLEMSARPDDDILGEAHFLSALHNANWEQGFEIVHHHCLQALRYCPSVAEAMRLYADIHIRRAPSLLCYSFLKVAISKSLHALSFFHTPLRARKPLNLKAIQGISSALESLGMSQQSRLDEQVKQQHGVLSEDVDLLQPAYCSTSYAMLEGYWPDKAAFYRAYDSVSRFLLISERACTIKLIIAYRARTSAPSQCLKVEINGHEAACLPASEFWQTREVNIPVHQVAEGENLISLKWPLPTWSKQDRIEWISERLDQGDFSQVYPVFGELHTFRASARL